MDTPNPPSVPPEKLDELVRAMHGLRDELLKASFLLRDHLDQTDQARREQARQAAEAVIRRLHAK